MIKSSIEQTPATKNQIQNKKPNIIKNANVLQGYISQSTNGGMLRPICFAPIMAGTKVMEHRIRLNIKMLTPKTPAFQKLKGCVRTYFVPNQRVWPNWEKFSAQKGGANQEKITEVPNLGGKILPIIKDTPQGFTGPSTYKAIYTDTDIFRDSYASTYIPRYQSGYLELLEDETTMYRAFPKYDALPLRGFKAIYNDFERNKEYDSKLQEYFTDEVSQEEYESYISYDGSTIEDRVIRGKKQNSYYTDYRTQLLGIDEEYPLQETPDMLSSLVEYQKLVAESRNQAENAQLNDWDIIAKEHGTRKLTQGKVQLLGTREFGINYQSVTQSAYNINEEIEKEFQVLGEQGAYSYTEIDLPIYQMTEFIEDGYIHCILQISCDTVYETAFERQLLNVNVLDRYRPELKELKDDVMYNIEKTGTHIDNAEELTQITGYKRKYNEYFKLPNSINGDLTSNPYYETRNGELPAGTTLTGTKTTTKDTFQFFEKDDKYYEQLNTTTNNIELKVKAIWKDYTDLLINKNQAIRQNLDYTQNTQDGYNRIRILGDNQFIMLGMQTMVCDMPIDENIKNNYTTWGEM